MHTVIVIQISTCSVLFLFTFINFNVRKVRARGLSRRTPHRTLIHINDAQSYFTGTYCPPRTHHSTRLVLCARMIASASGTTRTPLHRSLNHPPEGGRSQSERKQPKGEGAKPFGSAGKSARHLSRRAVVPHGTPASSSLLREMLSRSPTT
eukprot:scaffold16684_cov42-Phaeocystis_antarctica.AAC.3